MTMEYGLAQRKSKIFMSKNNGIFLEKGMVGWLQIQESRCVKKKRGEMENAGTE